MDMIDKIEEYQVQVVIANYVKELQGEFRYRVLCKEIVMIMQSRLDKFLDTLSKDFIYDYDIYTYGNSVKFKFNIKRRYPHGFLG